MSRLVALALAVAPLALADELAMFRPLVGACWTAQLSRQTTDTHCFTPVYGGAHLRDRHQVKQRGHVIYQGETIYSRDGAAVVFTYINSLGGEGRGSARMVPLGIDFTLTMRPSPGEEPRNYSSQWRWVDANSYDVHADNGTVTRFRRNRGSR